MAGTNKFHNMNEDQVTGYEKAIEQVLALIDKKIIQLKARLDKGTGGFSDAGPQCALNEIRILREEILQ